MASRKRATAKKNSGYYKPAPKMMQSFMNLRAKFEAQISFGAFQHSKADTWQCNRKTILPKKRAVKRRFIKQIFPFLFRTACRRLRDLCTQFSLMALINYPRLNWRILRVSQSEIFHHIILSMRRVLWENAWMEFISPPLFTHNQSWLAYSSSELVAS